MASENRKQDRNLAILIVVTVVLACALLIGLLVRLSSQHAALQSQHAFERAVDALKTGDRQAAQQEWRTLRESRDYRTHADLIECGLMLIDRQPETALGRLQAMETVDSLGSLRSILIARALADLNRLDDAEAEYRNVLKSDSDNRLALRGLQRIDDVRTAPENDPQFIAMFKPTVDKFCGDCHPTALPESFPRSHWAKEVKQGFEFYKIFDRHDLVVPDEALVRKYFEFQAPHELDLSPIVMQLSHEPSPEFVLLQPAAPASANPGVAHVSWVALEQDHPPVVLVTDMRDGTVSAVDPNRPDQPAKTLGTLHNPCHTTTCDLNADGNLDLLVAELGSFYPEDHNKGRVVCLKSDGAGHYEPVVLLDKVARVADVQPGDFDSDGDLDLVVAEFGWRTTGRVLYLENVGQSPAEMKFEMREVDPRHGTIHVPVIDLNQDGHLDFIALITQEHEAVVCFLNDGSGNFKPHTLYSANDPSFGSSGIQLVDLDQDNDVDVLYTNGDTFDSDLMKPYHGIQWLENKGNLEFEYHHVLNCFGVYRAVAGDVDADGDLDILAVTSLPVKAIAPEFVKTTDSIICLINDGQQNFEKQVIERGVCFHTTCDVGDFDGDGDLDLVTARLNVYSEPREMPPIDVWQNQNVAGGLRSK